MNFSEIEKLIDDWIVGYCKVFHIKYFFADPEIVVVLRDGEDLFKVDKNKSTTVEGPWNKKEIKEALINKVLEYKEFDSVNVNYRYERTKGCECGAWAIKNGGRHSRWCKLYE